MNLATFVITTDANARPGYAVTTYDDEGNVVEKTSADYSSASSRNRAVKKMKEALTSNGLTELSVRFDPTVNGTQNNVVSTVTAGLRSLLNDPTLDAPTEPMVSADDAASADEFARRETLVANVTTNPAKIANAYVAKIATVEDIDLVLAAEIGERARKGILTRLAKRRCGIARVAELEASYSEAESATETHDADASSESPSDEATDAPDAEQVAFDAELAAAVTEADEAKKAKKATGKRAQARAALAEFAEDVAGYMDGAGTEILDLTSEERIPAWAKTHSHFWICWVKPGDDGDTMKSAAGFDALMAHGLRGSLTKEGLVVTHLTEAEAHAEARALRSKNDEAKTTRTRKATRLAEAEANVERLTAKLDAVSAELAKGGAGIVKRTLAIIHDIEG